jgi:hypothetical protein
VGIEHVGIRKAWVVPEIDHNAQIMEETHKRILAGQIRDAIYSAQFLVSLVSDEILTQTGKPVFDCEPAGWKRIAQMLQPVRLALDGALQFIDT